MATNDLVLLICSNGKKASFARAPSDYKSPSGSNFKTSYIYDSGDEGGTCTTVGNTKPTRVTFVIGFTSSPANQSGTITAQQYAIVSGGYGDIGCGCGFTETCTWSKPVDISVTVTASATSSSSSCPGTGTSSTYTTYPGGGAITEVDCSAGAIVSTVTYNDSGDHVNYASTTRPNGYACAGFLILLKSAPPASGSVDGFRKQHITIQDCSSADLSGQGEAPITVTVKSVDCSWLSGGASDPYCSIAYGYASQECATQHAVESGTLDACISKQVAAFKDFYAACKSSAGSDDRAQAFVTCMKTATSNLVDAQLSALLAAASTATTCAIDGVGWLLCPVLTAGAGLADSAYGFLADSFLRTDPSLVNTDPKAKTADGTLIGTGTYSAWKLMQAIANVAFVIVFLIIIFSQLSGVGVNQYGVKKTLPRLIVGAVLVNVSFYVCQIAIDLSNILGYSLKDLLTSVARQATASGGGAAVSTTDDSGNLVGITATVLAAGAAAWINVGAVVVAIAGAIVTLLTIFVLLIVRKALIVLLVVIAPLAFVAFLLPNTETYFKKWRKLFATLLLLFPVVGLLYGGCLLASAILKQVAGHDTVMQIAAYIVLVVPLIAAIPLLKGALDGVGKLGGTIQGLGNRASTASGKKAASTLENSRLGQLKAYQNSRWAQRRAAIQGGTYKAKGGNFNPLNWASGANRGMNRIGGRFGSQIASRGAALASKEDAELLGNAGSRLDTMNFKGMPLSQAQMMQVALGQNVTHDGTAKGTMVASKRSFDEYGRRAAIERAAKIATVDQAHQLVDASSARDPGGNLNMGLDERRTLANALAGSSAVAKAPYLGGRTLDQIAQGTATSDGAALEAIQGGKITAEVLAGGNEASVSKLVSVATATPAGSPERAALQSARTQLTAPGSHLGERIVSGGDHDKAIDGIRSL